MTPNPSRNEDDGSGTAETTMLSKPGSTDPVIVTLVMSFQFNTMFCTAVTPLKVALRVPPAAKMPTNVMLVEEADANSPIPMSIEVKLKLPRVDV